MLNCLGRRLARLGFSFVKLWRRGCFASAIDLRPSRREALGPSRREAKEEIHKCCAHAFFDYVMSDVTNCNARRCVLRKY